MVGKKRHSSLSLYLVPFYSYILYLVLFETNAKINNSIYIVEQIQNFQQLILNARPFTPCNEVGRFRIVSVHGCPTLHMGSTYKLY